LAVILTGLARIEADVLQQQDVTVRQPLGTGQRVGPDDVTGQLHVPAELFAERGGDRCQRQLRVGSILGTTQVCGDHHLGAGLQQRLQRGHRRDDAAGVCDIACVIKRNIQIATHQHATPRNPHREKVFEVRNAHG